MCLLARTLSFILILFLVFWLELPVRCSVIHTIAGILMWVLNLMGVPLVFYCWEFEKEIVLIALKIGTSTPGLFCFKIRIESVHTY